MVKRAAILGLIIALAGCAQTQIDESPESLGEFKLRVNYAFADNAVQGPVSRSATPQEWTEAIELAVDQRLARYQGTQEYDVGISLEGFMLAPPGVPVLMSPRSTAIVLVNIYDVEQEVFLAKAHQMQVFEDTSSESAVLGSGYARTREEQMAGLALNVADKVEEWMAEQHSLEGWFEPRSDTSDAPDAVLSEGIAEAG